MPSGNSAANPGRRGGLMGMAVHPQLLSGKPYVYLAYVHRFIETSVEVEQIRNRCRGNGEDLFAIGKPVPGYRYISRRKKAVSDYG